MKEKRYSRPKWLFYALGIYIILQFSWWAYLLFDLTSQLHDLSSEADIQWDLEQKKYMILGEGAVFLFLLLLGFYITHKAIKREMATATMQKNFLLSVTHELKSPISSAKLYLQTLLHRDLERVKQTSILEKAIIDTERLNLMVENLLLANRVESGAFSFYAESINLSEVTERQCALLKETIGRDHQMELNIEKNIYTSVDQLGFNSILSNLIENAIKYSPKNSLIQVQLMKGPKEVILMVSDEGTGIPPSQRKFIFEKFYRIGNENTRKTKGTGLGLYIVREIIKLHNGKIEILDKSDGRGIIFQVRFPNQKQ